MAQGANRARSADGNQRRGESGRVGQRQLGVEESLGPRRGRVRQGQRKLGVDHQRRLVQTDDLAPQPLRHGLRAPVGPLRNENLGAQQK